MNQQFFEIDFLPVWDGHRCGDAICCRYGVKDEYSILSQEVLVIDGGTKESGEKLCEHINKFYNTSIVNYLLNTHPDQDHSSGASVVLEKLTVNELYLHRPWEHSEEIKKKFKDGRWTTEGLMKNLKESYPYAYELEEIACKKKIPIIEPFQGIQVGKFLVLSPSRNTYLNLVPNFSQTPESKEKPKEGLFKKLAEAVIEWIEETWELETLGQGGNVTATNESSVVLYGKIDDKKLLFTGDAGTEALSNSIAYLGTPPIMDFMQVPHHGGRKNVNPLILDALIGKKISKGESNKLAYVSVSKETVTHPRKIVVNAFIRRGAKVVETRGNFICFKHNIASRPGWIAATELPFYNKVERNTE